MSAAPTPAELAILTEIARVYVTQGIPPTTRELAEFLGFRAGKGRATSTNWVAECIAKLERKELVTRYPGKARGVLLTSAGRRWCPQFATAGVAP